MQKFKFSQNAFLFKPHTDIMNSYEISLIRNIFAMKFLLSNFVGFFFLTKTTWFNKFTTSLR